MTDRSKVIQAILKGKEDQDSIGDTLRTTYKIEGKVIGEWESFFRVIIPEDPFPAECRQLLVLIGNKYEEATRLSREYFSRKQILESVYEAQYNTFFVEEYDQAKEEHKDKKRMPSKEVLERKAGKRATEFEDMMVHSDIIYQFFKQIADKLANQRKIIENISITHGIEAKLSPIGGTNNE